MGENDMHTCHAHKDLYWEGKERWDVGGGIVLMSKFIDGVMFPISHMI